MVLYEGVRTGRQVTEQDMNESSVTVVKCGEGLMDDFKVEVELLQGTALSPFCLLW